MKATGSSRHDDRLGLATWLAVGVTLAGLAVGMSAGRVVFVARGADGSFGLLVGAIVVLLAIWGLPSVSIRFTARILLLVSGAVMARFGSLTATPGNGIDMVAAWIVGAVATLVLTDRIGTEAVRDLTADGPAPSADRRRVQATRTVASLAVLGAMAVMIVVLASPFANSRFSSATEAGNGPEGFGTGAGASLRASDTMDMTVRPELSDEILLTVRSDRRSFLRGTIYDQWDGTTWTRADTTRYELFGGTVQHDPLDLAANAPEVFTQRVQVVAPYADLYVAAPTAVKIESTSPAVQSLDGALSTYRRPLGSGAVYTVTSRMFALTAADLRSAAGVTPASLLDRYAQPPVITDRTVALADRIIAEAEAVNTFDKIVALEAWMGDNTEYSIDTPASPKGVDPVDHFLFESQLGWCEQIASSLVVMARSQGIPARVATGFVASERDTVTGDLVVRGTDAHAWAEVWFPQYGWVPFDPTADVPLAATADKDSTWSDWVRNNLLWLAAGVVALTVFVFGVGVGLRRTRRWRADRPRTPVARLDRDLGRLGRRHGLERSPNDTAVRYAERVARRADRPELTRVGQMLDDHLYARGDLGSERRAEAVAILREALADAPSRPASRRLRKRAADSIASDARPG